MTNGTHRYGGVIYCLLCWGRKMQRLGPPPTVTPTEVRLKETAKELAKEREAHDVTRKELREALRKRQDCREHTKIIGTLKRDVQRLRNLLVDKGVKH